MAAPDLGLSAPRLDWYGAGGPRNLDFQDGYFSDADGAGESRAVFLEGCHLPQAWQDRPAFVIGELGFGTGLNFLSTWALWRKTRPSAARLHFISIESAPFSRADLRRAQGPFAGLDALAQALRRQWPAAIKGVHRLVFDEDGLTLTLFFMDVQEALAQMETPADAWFLDGFAPSRNGAMWSEAVFGALARLSRPGTRAATFSVAGAVRRGLASAGFAVRKMPGYGRKRQRLEALYEGPPRPSLRRPTRPAARPAPASRSVLIIGGGIAGASAAQALLRRGLAVTLVSKDGLADEASGNAAALVSPRLDLEDSPQARFFRTAFAHAVRCYESLGTEIWHPCGLLRRPAHDKDADKFARLAQSGALPADDLTLVDEGPALAIASAGFVLPGPVIAAMTRGARLVRARVSGLRKEGGNWCARDASGAEIARAPLAVLALGQGQLAQTAGLAFRYLRGQVNTAPIHPAHDGPALLADGYALGLPGAQLLYGATFEPLDGKGFDPHPDAAAEAHNFAMLQGFAPALAARLERAGSRGRVAVRAATPDQMPYAGPLVQEDDFVQRFAALRDGFLDPGAGEARLQEGLFVLMGLGSRGFTLAPILGEALACEALGEPSPLERGAAEALHPARVLERRLRARKN